MTDLTAETRQTDRLDPARANALLAALGRPERLAEGDALPPFFHQIHFWEAQPPEALGRGRELTRARAAAPSRCWGSRRSCMPSRGTQRRSR